MRTDYLRYDAASLQEYLRLKLTEAGVYDGQLYPGSDTKLLMDLFAWTFDVLTYMLNNTAANSLFADTEVYENMNRLVKLLSYNPRGYLTAYSQFNLQTNPELELNNKTRLADTCTIPKFTTIDTGKTDKYGNAIKYVFTEDYTFNTYSALTNNSTKISSTVVTPTNWPLLYNGEFRKYNLVFTSIGIPYEVFTLGGLTPDSYDNPTYIDHYNFHVYVEYLEPEKGTRVITEYTQVDNLILDAAFDDTAFELRLNENKEYTIKFGDDIHGKKLKEGSKIHVIYLRSNGEDGKIEANELNVNSMTLNIEGFANSTELLDICFNSLDNFRANYASIFMNQGLFVQECNKLILTNINASTDPQPYEDLNSIKENAPVSFRTGNRLITEYDYKTYIKNKYGSTVKDIWVCNNITYTTIFYEWLKKYGHLNIDIRKYYYRYADACDFNNIYLWMKSTKNENITDVELNKIVNDCNRIKSATAEIVPLNTVNTYFIPYVDHPDYPFDIMETQLTNGWKPPIRLRVKKKANTFINNEQIKLQINKLITEYFSLKNQKLGSVIDISNLYKQILDLGCVESIQTVHKPERDSNNEFVTDGLSFACFSPTPINGKDFEIFKYSKKLLPFQFGLLFTDSLLDLIEIENDAAVSIYNTGL